MSKPRHEDRPPKHIYLQYVGDGEGRTPDALAAVDELEVTWCRDRIFASDYEYVLKARRLRRKHD